MASGIQKFNFRLLALFGVCIITRTLVIYEGCISNARKYPYLFSQGEKGKGGTVFGMTICVIVDIDEKGEKAMPVLKKSWVTCRGVEWNEAFNGYDEREWMDG